MKPMNFFQKVRAKFLGILFFLSIGVGLVTAVPPWLLYCVVFHKRKEFTSITHPFCGVIFKLFGIRIEVEGELPPRVMPCMMLSNHQSFLDIPAILFGVSHSAFLAKQSLFKIFYFGPLLYYTGSVPVLRGSPAAHRLLASRIHQRMDEGYRFTAFPEGTRSEDGKLLPFKHGIFRIINSSPMPVLPLTLVGSGERLSKRGLYLRPGVVKIVVHPLIPAEEVKAMSAQELAERCAAVIGGGLP
jgi:1-acyl-sn-glycerol-3-phosphate acyltransferase